MMVYCDSCCTSCNICRNKEYYVSLDLFGSFCFILSDGYFIFVAMYNDYIKENKTRPAVYEMPIKDYARSPKGFF